MFFCFILIVSILESMEVVRRYFSNTINISTYQIIKLTILRSISSICSFFPFVVFLGSVVFYSVMHSKLELTAVKVVGFSTQNILKSLFIGVTIIGTLYISIWDGISAYSIRKVERLDQRLKQSSRNNDKSLTVTNSGIWFRDTYDSSSYIVSAKIFDSKTSYLYNVRLFEFGKNNDLKRSIHAEKATVKNGTWILDSCDIVTSEGIESKEVSKSLLTGLSFSGINKMVARPDSVSFWSIGRYVKMLDKVGLSTTKYQMHRFSRLSSILQMFSFAALVTAFCIRYNHRNIKSYMLKVAILISMAFPIHFFTNVLNAFGESGTLPISIAIFAIPSFVLLVGLIFSLKK